MKPQYTWLLLTREQQMLYEKGVMLTTERNRLESGWVRFGHWLKALLITGPLSALFFLGLWVLTMVELNLVYLTGLVIGVCFLIWLGFITHYVYGNIRTKAFAALEKRCDTRGFPWYEGFVKAVDELRERNMKSGAQQLITDPPVITDPEVFIRLQEMITPPS